MTSPSSNWSRPSSDAAWLSIATPWCKTWVTLMLAGHQAIQLTVQSDNFKKEQISENFFQGDTAQELLSCVWLTDF